MNQFVDALGKACPMPVILAKKEIDAGNTSFVVAVDNEVAVENLKRLAESQNYQASVETKDGNFHVTFVGDGAAARLTRRLRREEGQQHRYSAARRD